MRARIVPLAAIAALVCLLAVSPAAAKTSFKFGWPHGEKGNGTIVTQELKVGDFDRVALDGSIDVYVTAGETRRVEVTLDANLLENLVAEVEEGALRLDWRTDCRPSRKSRVDISLPELKGFVINGAGDVEITGARGPRLEIAIRGAGDMEIAGRVDALEVSVSGAGDIDARDLIAQDVSVRVSGAGDADVHAEKSIEARVSGVGDITYYGDPQKRDTKVSGVGSINHR